MVDVWTTSLESLEEISQDEEARRILLRLAELQQAGRMSTFLSELAADPAIDSATKGRIAELAADTRFLLALEDYCLRTERLH